MKLNFPQTPFCYKFSICTHYWVGKNMTDSSKLMTSPVPPCHHYCGPPRGSASRWAMASAVPRPFFWGVVRFCSFPRLRLGAWEAIRTLGSHKKFSQSLFLRVGYLVGWLDELVNCLHTSKAQDSRQVTASGEEWSFLANANLQRQISVNALNAVTVFESGMNHDMQNTARSWFLCWSGESSICLVAS